MSYNRVWYSKKTGFSDHLVCLISINLCTIPLSYSSKFVIICEGATRCNRFISGLKRSDLRPSTSTQDGCLYAVAVSESSLICPHLMLSDTSGRWVVSELTHSVVKQQITDVRATRDTSVESLSPGDRSTEASKHLDDTSEIREFLETRGSKTWWKH